MRGAGKEGVLIHAGAVGGRWRSLFVVSYGQLIFCSLQWNLE